MKLETKKALASRALEVGKARIVFNTTRLSEIKEAITKQDIKDLHKSGAITIKDPSGRRKNLKKKTRRRLGSRKKIVKTRKKDYMALTRKLRKFIQHLRKTAGIDRDEYRKLRKEIRAKAFKSKANLKERLQQ
jgi:large subunit ribosomal protein L19e